MATRSHTIGEAERQQAKYKRQIELQAEYRRTHDLDCVWPDCDDECRSNHYTVAQPFMPLCEAHMYQTWQQAQTIADKANDRHPDKMVTHKRGARKVVRGPVTSLGWIYYLRIDGHIKIGYASDLLSRLKQYPPTAEFIYAHRSTQQDEKNIHSMLKLRLAHGREWYAEHEDVLALIERHKAQHGPAKDPRIEPEKPTSNGRLRVRGSGLTYATGRGGGYSQT